MQPKVGTLIKTVMPVFPEDTFPADSHILKDAIASKKAQIAEKFGKYGSLKSLPAGIDGMEQMGLSMDGLPSSSLALGNLSGAASQQSISAASFASSEAAGLLNIPPSIFESKGFTTDSMPQMSSDALAGLGASTNAFTPQALAAGAMSPEKLAVAGLSPEMAAQMSLDKFAAMGLSPDLLTPQALAAGAISPEKLAAAGLSPEMAAQMSPEKLAAMGLSPDTLTPQALAAGAISPEKLAAAGLSPEMAAQMSPEKLAAMGLSPDTSTPQALAAGAISPEKLAAAGLSPETAAQMSPEKLAAMGLSPDTLTPQALAAGAISPEKLAAAGISPEMAELMPPEELPGLAPLSQEQSNTLALSELTEQASPDQIAIEGAQSERSTASNPSQLIAGMAMSSVLPKFNKGSAGTNAEEQNASMPPKAKKRDPRASLVLTDELSQPICGQKFEVIMPDGRSIKGSTDENGKAYLEHKITADCSLLLPDLDEGAW